MAKARRVNVEGSAFQLNHKNDSVQSKGNACACEVKIYIKPKHALKIGGSTPKRFSRTALMMARPKKSEEELEKDDQDTNEEGVGVA